MQKTKNEKRLFPLYIFAIIKGKQNAGQVVVVDIAKQIIDQRVNQIIENNPELFADVDSERRRSKAFLLLGVAAYLDVDLAEATQFITDGGNDGGFDAGCIITAEVLSAVSEIRAVNAGTKEFIGVKENFSAGDIVIFRCIDGEKGIFLSSTQDNAKSEDITHRIIWGSSFFKIAPNGTRIRILTDTVGMNISARIDLKEYSEGF